MYFPSAAYTVGLGAAAGLLYFVNTLVKSGGGPSERVFVIGCAVLVLPLGWYLPGAALAGFGLAVAVTAGGAALVVVRADDEKPAAASTKPKPAPASPVKAEAAPAPAPRRRRCPTTCLPR